MSKRQPPLIEPSGDQLPSPLFTPRPGWGGQLREWLRENAYLASFRLVLAAALAVVVISILRSPPTTQLAASPSPTPTPDTIAQTFRPGEGISHLAGRALDAYLATRPEYKLDAVRRLFAVDTLWKTVADAGNLPEFDAGAVIEFPHTVIEYAISQAEGMTAAQYRAWSR